MLAFITNTATASSTETHNGSYALEMDISGQVIYGRDTSDLPSIRSSAFTATAGDSLSMWYWEQICIRMLQMFMALSSTQAVPDSLIFHDTVVSTTGVWKNATTSINTTVCLFRELQLLTI